VWTVFTACDAYIPEPNAPLQSIQKLETKTLADFPIRNITDVPDDDIREMAGLYPASKLGCGCAMRVREVEYINYGPNDWWYIHDRTGGFTTWTFDGRDFDVWSDYTNNPFGDNRPLPTPYAELNSPSTGTHMFYVGGNPASEPDWENGENIILQAGYACWYFDGKELFVGGGGIHTIDFAADGVPAPGARAVFINFECTDTPFYYESAG